jgi:hypothetical protein
MSAAIGVSVDMMFQLKFENVVYVLLDIGQFFFACGVCDKRG